MLFEACGAWGGWTVLTALGTVGAVLVAVGLQWWLGHKERAARPALTLLFDEHKKSDETNPDTGAVIPYLRLAVSNAEGKRTAEDVEVLILSVDAFATAPFGGSGVHVWLANPALGWANSMDSFPRMSIPSGATRYVDVGRWTGLTPMSFILSIVPEPGSNRHALDPGGWKLRLAVVVRNGDATFWDAEIAFKERVQQGMSTPFEVTATVVRVKSATA